jgi:hypothetical protein
VLLSSNARPFAGGLMCLLGRRFLFVHRFPILTARNRLQRIARARILVHGVIPFEPPSTALPESQNRRFGAAQIRTKKETGELRRRTVLAPTLSAGYHFGPFDELATWNIAGSSGVMFSIDQEGAKPTMATYKLAEILKSRSDLNDDEIRRMSEDEAWQQLRASMSTRELGLEDQGDSEHQ